MSMDIITMFKKARSAPLSTRLAVLAVGVVLLAIPVVWFHENVVCQESWSDDCWIRKDASPSSERDVDRFRGSEESPLDEYQRSLD